MLRTLAIAVLILIAPFTVGLWMHGWSLLWIGVFDFWAFTQIFLASAYVLYRLDDRRAGIPVAETAY